MFKGDGRIEHTAICAPTHRIDNVTSGVDKRKGVAKIVEAVADPARQ